MHRLALFVAFWLVCGCDSPGTSLSRPDVVSDIASDENLLFFRTAGWLDPDSQEWQLPVHGWIHEPEDTIARRALFETVLEQKFDLTVSADVESNFQRRLELLIADNERGKTIVIELAGGVYELPKSAENGQFSTILSVSSAQLVDFIQKGRLPYSAITDSDESRSFHGEIQLLPPAGLSVISDIDDTAKISNVIDHKLLLEYTFLRDFEAAPGMAQLYAGWAAKGASFHFVSSSPWQLYEPLVEFLDASDFPWATYSLKTVRFRDDTLLDLFFADPVDLDAAESD